MKYIFLQSMLSRSIHVVICYNQGIFTSLLWLNKELDESCQQWWGPRQTYIQSWKLCEKFKQSVFPYSSCGKIIWWLAQQVSSRSLYTIKTCDVYVMTMFLVFPSFNVCWILLTYMLHVLYELSPTRKLSHQLFLKNETSWV